MSSFIYLVIKCLFLWVSFGEVLLTVLVWVDVLGM